MSDTMTHGADCSRPQPNSKRVNAGWMRLTCPDCGHVGSAAAPAPDTNVSPERGPRPIAATGYRCRVHNDQVVTWRGTGCPRCASDLKARNAPQRDTYEMETHR